MGREDKAQFIEEVNPGEKKMLNGGGHAGLE